MKKLEEYLEGDGKDFINMKRGEMMFFNDMLRDLDSKIKEQDKKIDFIMENSNQPTMYGVEIKDKNLKQLYQENNEAT